MHAENVEENQPLSRKGPRKKKKVVRKKKPVTVEKLIATEKKVRAATAAKTKALVKQNGQPDGKGAVRDLSDVEGLSDLAAPKEIARMIKNAHDKWGIDLTQTKRVLGVRPTYCTEDRTHTIAYLVAEKHLTFRDACAVTGIGASTGNRWRDKARKFELIQDDDKAVEAMRKAEPHLDKYVYFERTIAACQARRSMRLIGDIVDAADIPNAITGQKDAKTKLDVLSRLDPRGYGRKGNIAHEIGGPGGGAVQVTNIVTLAALAQTELDKEMITARVEAEPKQLEASVIDVDVLNGDDDDDED